MPELTCTPQQACDALRNAGFNIGYDKLRAGLQQDIFPFGKALKMDKNWAFIVYVKDLEKFITEHGGEVGEGVI